MDWDPTILDSTIYENEKWFDAISDLSEQIIASPFDEFGDFKHRKMDLHFFDAGEMTASEDDNVLDFNLDDEVEIQNSVIL